MSSEMYFSGKYISNLLYPKLMADFKDYKEKKEKSRDRKDSRKNRSYFNKGNKRGSRQDSRRDDRPKEMFKTICDECGEKCEVPFKPSAGKPVLCSKCFEKKKIKDTAKKDKDYTMEFDTLNAKLDLVLKEIIELKKSKSKTKK